MPDIQAAIRLIRIRDLTRYIYLIQLRIEALDHTGGPAHFIG